MDREVPPRGSIRKRASWARQCQYYRKMIGGDGGGGEDGGGGAGERREVAADVEPIDPRAVPPRSLLSTSPEGEIPLPRVPIPPDVNEAGIGDQGLELNGPPGVAAAARSTRSRDPVKRPEGCIEIPAEHMFPLV